MTGEQMLTAAAKLDRADAVRRLINEAGKGLMDVYNEAGANAIKLATLAKLQIVQGYLTEAAVLLVESVALDEPPALELPGGDPGAKGI